MSEKSREAFLTRYKKMKSKARGQEEGENELGVRERESSRARIVGENFLFFSLPSSAPRGGSRTGRVWEYKSDEGTRGSDVEKSFQGRWKCLLSDGRENGVSRFAGISRGIIYGVKFIL